jgi:hypothetical protein
MAANIFEVAPNEKNDPGHVADARHAACGRE